MLLQASTALLALQFLGAVVALPAEQIPLHSSSEDVQEIRAKYVLNNKLSRTVLTDRLVTAEIIPTGTTTRQILDIIPKLTTTSDR
jgi:hypothetical protein